MFSVSHQFSSYFSLIKTPNEAKGLPSPKKYQDCNQSHGFHGSCSGSHQQFARNDLHYNYIIHKAAGNYKRTPFTWLIPIEGSRLNYVQAGVVRNYRRYTNPIRGHVKSFYVDSSVLRNSVLF